MLIFRAVKLKIFQLLHDQYDKRRDSPKTEFRIDSLARICAVL